MKKRKAGKTQGQRGGKGPQNLQALKKEIYVPVSPSLYLFLLSFSLSLRCSMDNLAKVPLVIYIFSALLPGGAHSRQETFGVQNLGKQKQEAHHSFLAFLALRCQGPGGRVMIFTYNSLRLQMFPLEIKSTKQKWQEVVLFPHRQSFRINLFLLWDKIYLSNFNILKLELNVKVKPSYKSIIISQRIINAACNSYIRAKYISKIYLLSVHTLLCLLRNFLFSNYYTFNNLIYNIIKYLQMYICVKFL